MMRKIVLRTSRLEIEPKTIEEMEVCYNKEVDKEMKQVYAEMIELMKQLIGNEEWASDWTIRLNNGKIIGGICFKGMADKHGVVEIGYEIYENFRNNGYATEAVGVLVHWALCENDVKIVIAETEKDNIVSQKVLKNSGFIYDGKGNEGLKFKIEFKEK